MNYINSMGAGGAFFFTCYNQKNDESTFEETLASFESDGLERCRRDKEGNLIETNYTVVEERIVDETVKGIDISICEEDENIRKN